MRMCQADNAPRQDALSARRADWLAKLTSTWW